MEFQGIEEFMRYLKTKYDESERKQEWRALSGRDHVSSSYDTFIFTDQKVYQIKSLELMPQRMVAVANEVGGPSPDMLDLVRGGAPVPLSVISKAKDASAVVMFGMQQYSSDVADVVQAGVLRLEAGPAQDGAGQQGRFIDPEARVQARVQGA